MTDSFRKIDYRLRPAKHAERGMLVDTVKRMRFGKIEEYQYVGFGSVAFIDHRMMHRSTGMSNMISVEGSADPVVQQRFRNNVPLGCIAMQFGMSHELLPNFDFKVPSIIWLDYDDQISRSMINDLQVIGQNIVAGSFIAVTFTVSYPSDPTKRKEELERLRAHFPDFINDDVKPSQLEGTGLCEVSRQAFSASFERALADADVLKPQNEKRRLKQVCYFRYRDGAPMCTLGWIVIDDQSAQAYEDAAFDTLTFYRDGSIPFNIRIPKVTPLEIREIERRLPDWQSADIHWIPEGERRDFADLYRYLPTFAMVEPL